MKEKSSRRHLKNAFVARFPISKFEQNVYFYISIEKNLRIWYNVVWIFLKYEVKNIGKAFAEKNFRPNRYDRGLSMEGDRHVHHADAYR